jgi:hypothetical protein
MTVSRLSFRMPYSAHRDCMVVIRPLGAAYQAVCVDAATRLTIGSPTIPRGPDGRRPVITADDVLRLIGGMYRLASVAVDIEAEELAQRSRRISVRLRLRRRLWRRQKRPAKMTILVAGITARKAAELRDPVV